jgi:hypothetical protein
MAHDTHHSHHISTEMRRCIDLCLECHSVCLETITHCLHMGGEHTEPHHLRLMMDCAEICQTSANFMLRGSDLHGMTCAICADICERCAEDCEQFDDAQMEECAEVCRRCADSCQEMAAEMGFALA